MPRPYPPPENRPCRAEPNPPHPDRRDEPLPWQRPKPLAEDADAPSRIQAILGSDSYRQADEDPGFFHRDDTRGLRLQVDYLKPELLLNEHGIEHTIVVFGSTRIPEPWVARQNVADLETASAASPDDRRLAQRLAIARRIAAKSHYYDIARAFGRRVSDALADRPNYRAVVVTGGGPGIMEAANRGAFDAGAQSVGLNITLPHEQYPNPYITPRLCFRFHYFALRKLHFLLRARALVAFPGGYGTLDELFETLTLVQTRKIKPLPIVLVGREYWERAIDIDFMIAEGVIDIEDGDLFWYAETADEIWDGIQRWYAACGEPLFLPGQFD
ncbi:LOG family protein [Salinisphaera sp. SPP-AMP-43]|uniref:LOG family protein n=1 Tax=Salinisphaera sp. SPP-AMP-43 TaxID=3121288 RepID=UPI003C6E5A87